MAFQFQVIAPFAMPINASTYTEAVKNFIKLHRDASINQLIVQDQLNNNRMLANIKYYTSNNKNKFSASLVPTTLTTLQNGGMYPAPGMWMGRDPYNRPFTGFPALRMPSPVLGRVPSPVLGMPLMYGRPLMPINRTATTGSQFGAGTIITPGTIIGPNVEISQGSILPIGSVIDATTIFPSGTIITLGTNILPGTNQPAGIVTPVGPIPAGADWTAGAGGNPLIYPGSNITFTANTHLAAGTYFPPGTFIGPALDLPSNIRGARGDTILNQGTVISNTTFQNGSTLTNGTIINKGTNIPANTTLPAPGITLPAGSEIKLITGTGPYNIATGLNPGGIAVPPFGSIFRPVGAFVIPPGAIFPQNFVFPAPIRSSNFVMPVPLMTNTIPIPYGSRYGPTYHGRSRSRSRSRSHSPRSYSPRSYSPRSYSPRSYRR